MCLGSLFSGVVCLPCLPVYGITLESPTSPPKEELLRKLVGLLLEPLSKMGAGDKQGQGAQESGKTG